MDNSVALEADLSQFNPDMDAKLQAYVHASGKGFLLGLRVGSFFLLLVDPHATNDPITFSDKQSAKHAMASIMSLLLSDNGRVQTLVEDVQAVGNIQIEKFIISLIIGPYQLMLVDLRNKALNYLFFNTQEDTELILSDISARLGTIATGEEVTDDGEDD